MQSIRSQLLASAITLFSLGAGATENSYSEAYGECMDASNGVTLNMLDCIDSELKRQDARLTQSYKAAMQGLTTEQQRQLRDAQRLWIKFRDADCALLSDLTGGTIDSLNSASCLLDRTGRRADDLAWLAAPGL